MFYFTYSGEIIMFILHSRVICINFKGFVCISMIFNIVIARFLILENINSYLKIFYISIFACSKSCLRRFFSIWHALKLQQNIFMSLWPLSNFISRSTRLTCTASSLQWHVESISGLQLKSVVIDQLQEIVYYFIRL